MKIPLEWLKEYVAVRLKPEALASRLTMAGLEVVGILDTEGHPVFDVEVTPNRADCLSIIGVAREVAAITGATLRLPQGAGGGRQGARKIKTPHPIIRIEDRKGCPRYIGRLIEGVRVGSSPLWMQRRLIACGTRPVNNVVDITNYVLFEYGQPLHAFDFNRLSQGTILVRRAHPNETVTTLDGMDRRLSPETLVIADARQPVAVAGIMGGLGSEVTPQTTRVLLESAFFDPLTVRRAARQLGLASESSYRFERGVDPGGVEIASGRAASLIRELAGGEEAVVRDIGVKRLKRKSITLEPRRLSRWLGTRIEPQTIRTTLAQLSCRVASSGASPVFRVRPPSFRQDLTQEVDLYEELARMTGYHRIPTPVPTTRMVSDPSASEEYRRIQSLRCLCASLGLTETVTWSLVSEAELSRYGYRPSHAARLANPLSQDHAYLRPSLLMGMGQVIRRNLTQAALGARLFEIGSVVRLSADDQQRIAHHGPESVQLGIALSGLWSRDWRAEEPCDFFRLKGVIEALTGRLCDGAVQMVREHYPWAEPGQSAEVRLSGRAIGVAGQISRLIVQALDLTQDAWFAELSVKDLLVSKRSTISVGTPTVFPPVKRDLSIFVSEDIACEDVSRTISHVGGVLAGHVELIDRYTGKQVPQGQSSLTFSIEYRDASRTLTASEVDALHQRIGQTLVSRFHAKLR